MSISIDLRLMELFHLTKATFSFVSASDAAGHIACDSLSKSELVIPLVVPLSRLSHRSKVEQARRDEASDAELGDLTTAWGGRGDGDDIIVGLLDIDCVEEEGFDAEDQKHLEDIVKIIVESCDW